MRFYNFELLCHGIILKSTCSEQQLSPHKMVVSEEANSEGQKTFKILPRHNNSELYHHISLYAFPTSHIQKCKEIE